MQNLRQSFLANTDTFELSASYEPSHIRLRLVDHRDGTIKEGLYYDSNLPEEVKKQCDSVGDLYQYLQGKPVGDLQVSEKGIQFKVVKIKKEHWYPLNLQISENTVELLQRNTPFQMNQQERTRLIDQNQNLKRQIQSLKNVNNELEQRMSIQLKNIQQYLDGDLQGQQDHSKMMIEQPIPIKPKELALTPLTSCIGYSKYAYTGNLVTKLVANPAILVFQQYLEKGQSGFCELQIMSNFVNNWIIFGLTTKRHFDSPYCYFFKGTAAFSGSQVQIYNQMSSIDLLINPLQVGDRLKFRLNSSKRVLQWFVNDNAVCRHFISDQMYGSNLYPFLMLSNPGDSVILNSLLGNTHD